MSRRTQKSTQHNFPADLLEMISIARPTGSNAQLDWLERWFNDLDTLVTVDSDWNIVASVGGNSQTIFTSHADTVHKFEGRFDLAATGDGCLVGRKDDKPCILGADDTAGVWIMRQMIKAKVPGLYVFHDGEEIGCAGSSQFVKDFDLTPYRRVVSFDRMGYSDVITHQSHGRTCSDTFARALSASLNQHGGFTYKPSPNGMYTDSNEYAPYVSECTNISVGYSGQHTINEKLCVSHLTNLAAACIKIDWESLPAERDPKQIDYRDDWWRYRTSRDDQMYQPSIRDVDEWSNIFLEQLDSATEWDDLVRFTENDPEGAAALLHQLLGYRLV
jgi:hypothetical protein